MTERATWHRLLVNGMLVDVSEVSQQESLEGGAPVGATVTVTGSQVGITGQAASLHFVNRADWSAVPQMGGQLDELDTEGFPHRREYLFLGKMAKTRRTRSTDHTFTGTDGDAVKTVLDFCGIPYLAADIVDCGYQLSLRVPNIWLADDVTGADIIRDIDRVFQTRTTEVGDGRVVRFRYDLVPSMANAVATFTAGSSDVLWGVARRKGKFDVIRNVARVRGAQYDCGTDDSCSCVPWASAEADHPKLGAGVRTVPVVVNSDLIQTTGLAKAVATDLMRRYNREQDQVRVRTLNDPNVTVGKIIGVVDPTLGIDLAAATAFQVVDVSRVGGVMIIEAVGGAAGAVGTLTSGIEQVCNDLRTQLPETPPFDSFSMPAINFPPFVGGITISERPEGSLQTACTTDADCPVGKECIGGVCVGSCQDCAEIVGKQARAACEAEYCASGHESVVIGQLTDWVQDEPNMTTGPSGIRFDDFGAGHYEGLAIAPGRSWEMTVEYQILQDEVDVGFVVGRNAFDPWIEIYIWAPNNHPDQRRMSLAVYNLPSGPDSDNFGSPWPDNGDRCVLVWSYNSSTNQSVATLEFGAPASTTIQVSAPTAGSIGPFDPSYFGVYASTGGVGPAAQSVEIESWSFRYT